MAWGWLYKAETFPLLKHGNTTGCVGLIIVCTIILWQVAVVLVWAADTSKLQDVSGPAKPNCHISMTHTVPAIPNCHTSNDVQRSCYTKLPHSKILEVKGYQFTKLQQITIGCLRLCKWQHSSTRRSVGKVGFANGNWNFLTPNPKDDFWETSHLLK